MARTKRPAINMDRQACPRMVRQTLLDVNPEVEDMISVRSKVIELLKLHQLKVTATKKNKSAYRINAQRLIHFFECNPEKCPTVKQLQPYETFINTTRAHPSEIEIRDLCEIEDKPILKKSHIEIIDLTMDD